jgi:hypothetical protein
MERGQYLADEFLQCGVREGEAVARDGEVRGSAAARDARGGGGGGRRGTQEECECGTKRGKGKTVAARAVVERATYHPCYLYPFNSNIPFQ